MPGKLDIVIHTRRFSKVTINTRDSTALIEAGASVGEVIREADEHGKQIGRSYSLRHGILMLNDVVMGGANHVGAIGFTLAGGLSRFQSFHGLAIDTMVSARVVTAKGDAITVSATENEDLWWGMWPSISTLTCSD